MANRFCSALTLRRSSSSESLPGLDRARGSVEGLPVVLPLDFVLRSCDDLAVRAAEDRLLARSLLGVVTSGLVAEVCGRSATGVTDGCPLAWDAMEGLPSELHVVPESSSSPAFSHSSRNSDLSAFGTSPFV